MSVLPFQSSFAYNQYRNKYARAGEEWPQTSARVTYNVMDAIGKRDSLETDAIYGLVNRREFLPGGRYLAQAGSDFHQVQNCLLLKVEDTRESWAELAYKTFMSLMTGAGIGVYYGDLREAGAPIKRTGGVATGPVPLATSINEQARAAVAGGNRRSAIWAGLLWSHPDVIEFIRSKDWPEWLREQKRLAADRGEDVAAPLDMTNISVCLDDEFFDAYGDPSHPKHDLAVNVYRMAVDHMVTKGEPGFSVDVGDKVNEKLRNACTEITSEDDSDICNLGGVVLPRFDSPKAFGESVRYATLFLTAGTVYSDVPYEKVREVREKNRRLGLDVIGVHEFLLKHGVKYGSDDSFEVLEPYMAEYRRALEYAWDWQDKLGLSRSVAATSGAPTGTRGILAESTTGWEPVTTASAKRRVRHSGGNGGDKVTYEYVVDPTVKRGVEEGWIDAHDTVEDAYSLAYDYERRFAMQKYAQANTDQAISMTINLPYPITDPHEQQQFADTLIRYLPHLRGITCYPDGAIPGQPITPVPLAEALAHEGVVFEENEDKCASGVCGI